MLDSSSRTFGDLVDSGVLAISDGYRAKNDELGGTGPIFLRAGLVTDTHIELNNAERFHEPCSTQIASKLSRPYDVIVTTKGNSTGRVARISAAFPEVVYSPHLSYWRCLAKDELDPGFLFYWSRSSYFRRQLDGMKVSTDMAPYLSLVDQKRLRILLPSIQRQRAIARILGALDDKSELNRRTNETLEAMARAIFQSWFVDFDPVRAKMAGRQPEGMDAETAKLFPNSLDAASQLALPLGWRLGVLRDVLVLQRGFDLPRGERRSGPYPVVAASGEAGHHAEARAAGPGVVTGRSGVLGKVFLVWEDFWPLNTALWVKEYGASTPCHARFTLEQIGTEQFNAGSAVPTLNRNHIHNLPAVVAPRPVLERYENVAGSLLMRVARLDAESEHVRAVRDGLLPKLLSGELRIPEAERAAEAVL